MESDAVADTTALPTFNTDGVIQHARTPDYLSWNDAFATHFFNSNLAARRTILFVSAETVAEVASAIGGSPSAFVPSVKEGPPWLTRSGLCQGAFQAYERWRERSLRFPPYIAYLALFVLAAGINGNFASHNYYDRLRKLAGLTGDGQVASFNRMWRLWEDLERWSCVDNAGRLGIFRATIAGSMLHVGYPFSQTILSAAELSALPQVFSDAGIDASSVITDQELARILGFYGRNAFRARTRSLLQNDADHEQRSLLLQIVSEELADWDGSLVAEIADEQAQTGASGSLRLSLQLDTTARRATFRARCSSLQVLPLEAKQLLVTPSQQTIVCEQEMPQLSAPVRTDYGYLDASEYDWLGDIVASSEDWSFRLRGAPIRIFVDATPEGVSGYLETFALPLNAPIVLAFHKSASSHILPWLSEDCSNVDQLEITGLPKDWRLARVGSAGNTVRLSNRFPILARVASRRIRLSGGIKSASANCFYAFALPSVRFDDPDESYAIYCNGTRLVHRNSDNSYSIPVELASTAAMLSVEVRCKAAIYRRTIYLATWADWKKIPTTPWFDGEHVMLGPAADDKAAASGSVVVCLPRIPTKSLHPLIVEGLDVSRCRRIVLLGAQPGALLDWPTQQLGSLTFEAIWAIAFNEGLSAHYCAGVTPLKQRGPGRFTNREIREWKEFAWHRRLTVQEPRDPALARQWRRFVKLAGNAHAR